MLYEETMGWEEDVKSVMLARCRLCSVCGGIGDVGRSVGMGLSALSMVDGVDGVPRLSLWFRLMEEYRSGGGMLSLLGSEEGVADVGGWSAGNVEDVLNFLCQNKDKGVCSAVFGHVLGAVGDDVCAAALGSG